jgi:8-oxo-dGTP pyrophosphatase MutT (NUDIX family)
VAPTEIQVQAAGGVVRRRGPAGIWEIVVVHRPRYDDWSLPKGKLDPGETVAEAALREVEEETGLVCRLLRPFGETTYLDRKGRSKAVWYWVMEVLTGRFTPSEEVDAMRWLTIPESLDLLTYPRDRELLGSTSLDD